MRAEQMAARIERERIQAEAAEAARAAKAAEEGKIRQSTRLLIYSFKVWRCGQIVMTTNLVIKVYYRTCGVTEFNCLEGWN